MYDTAKTKGLFRDRILTSGPRIQIDNAFKENKIKSLMKKPKAYAHSAVSRKLPDIDNYASPLIAFQRVPAVPNRMGHSILMSLDKMFGGKLNIKIPPQPPVIMVNQSPYYSTI